MFSYFYSFRQYISQDESFSHLCEATLVGMEMLDSLATFADIFQEFFTSGYFAGPV